MRWTLPLVAVLAVLFTLTIHGILSVQAPLGAPVAVVEGWIPEAQLAAAADTLLRRGHQRVHTVGTVRPFSYHLAAGEAVAVDLRTPGPGTFTLTAAGLPGAEVAVVADGDTLVRWPMATGLAHFSLPLPSPVHRLTVAALNPQPPPAPAPSVFTLRAAIDGKGLHALQDSTVFLRPDGSTATAWPTYAHLAAAKLVDQGVPAERITIVPAWGEPDSRTWANAATFGAFARQQGYTTVDLLALGVHARRSRALMRRGCGDGIAVGVIALEDPRCPSQGWWRHWKGWFYVLKEVLGSGEPLAVDLTR
jgi:hypothetical protein